MHAMTNVSMNHIYQAIYQFTLIPLTLDDVYMSYRDHIISYIWPVSIPWMTLKGQIKVIEFI